MSGPQVEEVQSGVYKLSANPRYVGDSESHSWTKLAPTQGHKLTTSFSRDGDTIEFAIPPGMYLLRDSYFQIRMRMRNNAGAADLAAYADGTVATFTAWQNHALSIFKSMQLDIANQTQVEMLDQSTPGIIGVLEEIQKPQDKAGRNARQYLFFEDTGYHAGEANNQQTSNRVGGYNIKGGAGLASVTPNTGFQERAKLARPPLFSFDNGDVAAGTYRWYEVPVPFGAFRHRHVATYVPDSNTFRIRLTRDNDSMMVERAISAYAPGPPEVYTYTDAGSVNIDEMHLWLHRVEPDATSKAAIAAGALRRERQMLQFRNWQSTVRQIASTDLNNTFQIAVNRRPRRIVLWNQMYSNIDGTLAVGPPMTFEANASDGTSDLNRRQSVFPRLSQVWIDMNGKQYPERKIELTGNEEDLDRLYELFVAHSPHSDQGILLSKESFRQRYQAISIDLSRGPTGHYELINEPHNITVNLVWSAARTARSDLYIFTELENLYELSAVGSLAQAKRLI